MSKWSSSRIEVLLNPDVGRDAGWGHISRTLALASAFKKVGLRVGIAVSSFSEPLPARLHDFLHWTLDSKNRGDDTELLNITELIAQTGARAVVVDSYMVSSHWLEAIANHATLVAIDDFGRESLPARILINPTANASKGMYENDAETTTLLLGPSVAILDEPYWEARCRPAEREVSDLLITLGSSDPNRLLPRLIGAALEVAPPKCTITAVVGPFFDPSMQELERMMDESRLKLVRTPPSLASLISRMDLAICGGGLTVYEVAAFGVPAVVIPIAPVQEPHVRALNGMKAVLGVQGPPDAQLSAIKSAIRVLCRNVILREKLGRRAWEVVNARGALRIAEVVKDLLEAGATEPDC